MNIDNLLEDTDHLKENLEALSPQQLAEILKELNEKKVTLAEFSDILAGLEIKGGSRPI